MKQNFLKHGAVLFILLTVIMQTLHATTSIDQTLDVGAINGAHAVNLSGAFTYTIPIKIPEGTMGMQPNLSLNYNSQSGNGIAGYGWNLSGISAISRVNKTVYYDVESSTPDLSYDDGLSLDGKRIFYEPEADITEDGKKVRAYYSKIDDFQRIYTDDNELLENFTVKTKDGKTIEYGNSADSELKTGNTTLVWYINKVTDRNGNYMTYHYTSYGKQVVLSRIEYTGNGTTKPHSKVTFNYIDRTDKSHAFIAGAKVENYKLLNTIKVETNNQHYKSYKLVHNNNHFSYLTEFQEWGTPIISDGKSRLNSLTFEYGGNEGSSIEVLNFNTNPLFTGLPKSQTSTEKWVYIPGNFDGDGLQDFLGLKIEIKANTARYIGASVFLNNNKNGKSGFNQIDISNKKVNEFYDIMHYINPTGESWGTYLDKSNQPVAGFIFFTGDVNGDNIDDIVLYNQGITTYRYFESKGVGEYEFNYPANNLQVRENNIAKLIDADADGRLELFILDAGTSQNEKNHSYITSFSDRPYSYYFCDDFMGNAEFDLSKWELYSKDYEGTGKTQLIAEIFGEEFNRLLSFDVLSGTSCGGVSLTTMGLKSDNPSINSYHTSANRVDFNGDGKEDDLVLIPPTITNTSNTVFVSINNALNETNVPIPYGANNEIITADLNTDGFTDMIKISKGTSDKVTFYINKGEGTDYRIFSKQLGKEFFNDLDHYFDEDENLMQLTDIDGDGIQELFLKRPDLAHPKILRLNFNLKNRLLNSVYDSYANQTKVHYTTLSNEDNYSILLNLSHPYKVINGALYVVNQVEFSTNVTNQFGSKQYSYEDLIVHMWGKGMLGFSKVTEIDNLNGIKTESFFTLNTDNSVMLPEKSITFLKNGNVYDKLSETTSSYSYITHTQPPRDWLRLNETTKLDFTNQTKSITEYKYHDTNEGNLKETISKIYDTQSAQHALKYTTKDEVTYKNCDWWITYLPETVTTTLNRQAFTGSNSRTVKYEYNVANGNLKKETTDPTTTNEVVTTYSLFDKFGNPNKISQKAYGIDTERTSSVSYEATGRFATTRKDSQNNTIETMVPNLIWGVPTSVTDINGNTTTFIYDNYGRLQSSTDYLGNTNSTTYDWVSLNKPPKTDYDFIVGDYDIESVFFVSTDVPNAPNSIAYFDNFGREVLVNTEQFGDQNAYSFKKYDARGRLIDESGSFRRGDDEALPTLSSFTYDDLNRMETSVVKQYHMNNQNNLYTVKITEQVNYNYPTRMVQIMGTKTHNSDIMFKNSTFDVTGKLEKVEDAGGSLTYKYNNFNELYTVEDGEANILTKSEYDDFGRQTALIDINAGRTSYTYNPFDELTNQTDAKGNTTTIVYDNLGRIESKKLIDVDGTEIDYDYVYYEATENGALQLKSESGPNSYTTSYTYDDKGRLLDKTDDLSTVSFSTSQTYNSFGDTKTITYPDNFTINYEYDDATGALTKAKNGSTVIYEMTSTNHLGQITDYTYSNGTIPVNHSFNELGMPATTTATDRWDVTVFNWSYSFNKTNGNLMQRKEILGDDSFRFENFAYDHLHRLTHVSNQEVVKYAANGNIDEKKGAGTYAYLQPQGKINAVSSISNEDEKIPLLTEQIDYTAFDRPKSILENDKEYTINYGAQNQRLKTTLNNNGQETTRYYSGNFELLKEGDREWSIYYLSFANSIDVIYVKSGDYEEFHYTFTDYLGSILKVVNSGAFLFEHQSFDAWGKKRNPQKWSEVYDKPEDAKPKILDWLNRGYTGHEHLYEFGLINMNNRLYDPIVGRMLAVDNFVADSESTQAFNRYSYANNNPLKYVDPSGEWLHLAVGAVVGGIVNVVDQALKGNITSLGEGLAYFGIGAGAGLLVATGNMAAARVLTAGGNKAVQLVTGKFEPSSINSFGDVAGLAFDIGTDLLAPDITKAISSPITKSLTKIAAAKAAQKAGVDVASFYGNLKTVKALGNAADGIAFNATTMQELVIAVKKAPALTNIQKAKILGDIGETAVGITGKKVGIKVSENSYRFPDLFDKSNKLLQEVKNVDNLKLTRQIQDYLNYANKNGLDFEIFTRSTTRIHPNLQILFDNGSIVQKFIPGL